ncbi:MAG: endonuclease MutS2 [Defluviitaleaceae bacterium]|nr:endonuclease MutS2 [Defluviitaleaceae bacterium]
MKINFYKPLEYSKIVSLLSAKAISSLGKELAASLAPSIDKKEIEQLQIQTTTAVDMLLKKGSLPLGGAKDITQAIGRAALGGILNITELLHVGDFAYVCRRMQNYAKPENKDDSFPALEPFFAEIGVPIKLEKAINAAILNETEMRDDASPALNDIRRSIKQSNGKIKEMLNNIIHSSQYKNMLQDGVVTMRSGRFCVPIKQEYKGSFPGIVHDQSSTGATVFIEPMGVVTLNNKIRELASKEKEEIEAILKKLSLLVEEEVPLLKNNLHFITELDVIFAKGQLSLDMNGTQPTFNEKGIINIVKGRHPLINKTIVVPLNIYLGDTFSTLLITGPNTGGKTVALKTLGLFTLMGQAGLHVPAQSCELAVFENVFADIGDEQSIEQSLSTFSAHMTNIVKILEHATSNSLVLLDELGAGTDPTEGAALAISILEYLHKQGIRAAVTTHYSQLKLYALNTPGVENASCEFDINTLAPTYRLLIGVPGKSNAFAISKKLGLSDYIIDMARGYINSQEEKLEDIIADLETNKKTALMEEERAHRYMNEANRLKQQLNEQRQKFEQQKEKLLKKAKEQAQETLRAAEETANSIIKEMIAKSKEANLHEMDALRKSITSKIEEITPKPVYKPIKKLVLGDRVYIHTLNQSGVVSALPDTNADVLVKVGIMKVKVPITNLSLDTEKEEITLSPTVRSSIKAQKSKTISTSLDIRGKMVDEGLELTAGYLDDAYLTGLKQVTIIHGKGSGVLRSAIQKYLAKNPHVQSYRAGEFGEGDSGVTVVEVK